MKIGYERLKKTESMVMAFIRKAVPTARMGLDGLPVWERGAEKRE